MKIPKLSASEYIPIFLAFGLMCGSLTLLTKSYTAFMPWFSLCVAVVAGVFFKRIKNLAASLVCFILGTSIGFVCLAFIDAKNDPSLSAFVHLFVAGLKVASVLCSPTWLLGAIIGMGIRKVLLKP